MSGHRSVAVVLQHEEIFCRQYPAGIQVLCPSTWPIASFSNNKWWIRYFKVKSDLCIVTLTWGGILTLTFLGQQCFDASRCKERDGGKIISISLLVQKLSAKTRFFFAKTAILTFLDLQSLNVGDRSILMTHEWKSSSRAIDHFLRPSLPIIVAEIMAHFQKKYGISLNLTFDDFWWPLYWPERKMAEVTTTGIAAGYRMSFTHLSIFFGFRDRGGSWNHPFATARPARRRATARVNLLSRAIFVLNSFSPKHLTLSRFVFFSWHLSRAQRWFQ